MSGTRAATDGDVAELLAKVSQGDRAALRAIYVRQSTRLFGIAVAILRDRNLAADVLQVAFITVWDQARHFQPGLIAGDAWLTAIVRHAALQAARARGREIPSEDATLAETAIDPDALDAMLASDAGRALRDGLMVLEPACRRGIVLAYVHGFSFPELATRIEAPKGGVRSALRRGLAALQAALP